jgi:hypothetical protein
LRESHVDPQAYAANHEKSAFQVAAALTARERPRREMRASRRERESRKFLKKFKFSKEISEVPVAVGPRKTLIQMFPFINVLIAKKAKKKFSLQNECSGKKLSDS